MRLIPEIETIEKYGWAHFTRVFGDIHPFFVTAPQTRRDTSSILVDASHNRNAGLWLSEVTSRNSYLDPPVLTRYGETREEWIPPHRFFLTSLRYCVGTYVPSTVTRVGL